MRRLSGRSSTISARRPRSPASSRASVPRPSALSPAAGPAVGIARSSGTSKLKLVDYPTKYWNSWTPGASIEGRFVNVQSVFVDHLERLWILDVGAAYLGNITSGAPRLHRVDLATNTIVQTCAFNESYAPANSYLNDVRVGTDGKTAYLTNSNNGGLLVVQRRALMQQ